MKHKDVVVHGEYRAKVTRRKVLVRILRQQLHGFRALNLSTGREITISSARRLTAV